MMKFFKCRPDIVSMVTIILIVGHLSIITTAYPQDIQDDQTEESLTPTTEESLILQDATVADYASDIDDLDEAPLQDQMAKYTDVPFITGRNSVCKCGISLERISGGENAEISQYPWTTLLYSVESETYKVPYCGGALINSQYVLTASHCVDGLNPNKIEVVLREQNATMTPIEEQEEDNMLLITRSMVLGGGGRNTMGVLRIGVDKVIQHPKYSRNTQDNDIALIRLKVRVPLEGFQIAPICVPQETASFSQGSYATVAGYGATSETGPNSITLQMAQVRLLSNELCNTPAFHNGKISENMLCADGMGKGPCAGDTGGPLMIRSSRDSNRQVLAGLASWSSTCVDPTRPAVYTRVPMYESWILENTQDSTWCSS